MSSVTLDKPYEVKWTRRAQARLESLERPPSFTDLGRKSKKPFYALCAFVWASLVERAHRFDTPEDVADYLDTPDKVASATRAIGEAITESFPPDPKADGVDANSTGQTSSERGPSPSSSSASARASTPTI